MSDGLTGSLNRLEKPVASQRVIKSGVYKAISDKRSIGGRNPISVLCSAVEANDVAGKKMVEMALRDLESEDMIKICRRDDGRIDRIYALRPRGHDDRAPQQKREARSAEGVGPYLSDDQCGSVILTIQEPHPNNVLANANTHQPNQPGETTVSADTRGFDELPYHDQVTLALMALQDAADKNGNIYHPSTGQVIADKLGISLSAANEINKRLFHLGLRKSASGRGAGVTKPHWVSMEPMEFNAQTVNSLGGKKSSDKLGSGLVDDEVTTKLAEIVETLEQQVADLNQQLSEAIASAHQADRLAEIVVDLEERVSDRDKAVQKASALIDEVRRQNQQLKEQLAASEHTVRNLQAQLKPRPASQTIQDILKRHDKS